MSFAVLFLMPVSCYTDRSAPNHEVTCHPPSAPIRVGLRWQLQAPNDLRYTTSLLESSHGPAAAAHKLPMHPAFVSIVNLLTCCGA